MSRFYPRDEGDYFPRHRPDDRHRRDRSPDYYTGGAAPAQRPYSFGAMPVPPPVPTAPAHDRHAPFYRPPPNAGGDDDRLHVPTRPPYRPRSTPPDSALTNYQRHHQQPQRSRDSENSSEQHRRSHSPMSRTRHALHHTFSHSNSGLGAGMLGAVVGGLAAREASGAVARRGHDRGRSHSRRDEDNGSSAVMLSTIVGAAVGGLGANAVERRLEAGRERTKVEQERWERKWGREGDAADGRRGGRGRSRGGDGSGVSGDVDYVYDRRPRRRSEEVQRYRQ